MTEVDQRSDRGPSATRPRGALRDLGLALVVALLAVDATWWLLGLPASYVLVGSMGGAPTNPVWVYNLRSNPSVEIRDHAVVQPMRVREVQDAGERARLWKLCVAVFPPYEEYQAKATRQIPLFVAEAAK